MSGITPNPSPPRQAARYMPAPPPVALEPIPSWAWIGGGLLVLMVLVGAFYLFRFMRGQSKASDAAVAILHQKMTAADDYGIFATSDPVYQQNITAKASNAQFDTVREKLGAPRSSSFIDSESSELPSLGTFLTVRYHTVFEKGRGRETICLHEDHGAWKLAAYSVDSPLLQQVRPMPTFKGKTSSK